MSTSIGIPKLGWDMTEATLLEWLVEDGAEVAVSQPLYVLETDKVETTIDAPCSGVLRASGVVGEVYGVGTVIGVIENN